MGIKAIALLSQMAEDKKARCNDVCDRLMKDNRPCLNTCVNELLED